MNTIELDNIGRILLPQHFLGVFALDTIPHYLPNPCGFIVNTQSIHLPGQHWLSIVINQRNCYIFDSLGYPPPLNLIHFLRTRLYNFNFHYNSIQLQHPSSINCGLYALYHLYMSL